MGQIKTMAAASLMAVMTFAAVSCGPSAYTLSIETSRPSASGVDLAGKTVSVVYMDNGQEPDSLFAASMASAFVMELEDDYFGGDSLVPVFCLDKISGSDYFSKSSMADLLVEAGTDVLFLLDSPVFGTDIEARTVPSGDGAYTAVGTIPFSVNLYAYDSMDKRDTVLLFSGSSSANVSARINGTESREGIEYILKSGMEGAGRRFPRHAQKPGTRGGGGRPAAPERAHDLPPRDGFRQGREDHAARTVFGRYPFVGHGERGQREYPKGCGTPRPGHPSHPRRHH